MTCFFHAVFSSITSATLLRAMLSALIFYGGILGGIVGEKLYAQNELYHSKIPHILVLDSIRQYEALTNAEMYLESEGKLTFQEALNVARNGGFKAMNGQSLRIRGGETLWIRLRLRNLKLSDWVLLVGNNRIDTAVCFIPSFAGDSVFNAENFIRTYSGEMTELRTRAMQTKRVVFPLALTDDNIYTFYLKITAHYTPATPILQVIPAEVFADSVRLLETTSFVLIGMMIFAVIFNLVPLFIVRDKVYFWYVVHVITLLFYAVVATTLLAERWIPHNFKLFANTFVQIGAYMVFVQFVRAFLDAPVRFPRIFSYLFNIALVALSFVILLIPFGFHTVSVYFRVPTVFCTGLVILVILAIEIVKADNIPAKIYAGVLTVLVSTKFLMYFFGVLHEGFITSLVGVIEITLFSFALASRLTQMREQVAQERQQRVLAEKFNEQERIKNKELAAANEEISRQNTILAEQAREIELSNAHLNEVIIELDTALTDLKDTQSQLVASERVAAVGLLTAGVMHEINNPNAAISAALEQMQIKIKEQSDFFHSLLDEESQNSQEAESFRKQTQEIEHMMNIALQGAQRVKHIVASLRNFTKHQEEGVKSGSLEQEIQGTIEMFRYQFKNVVVVSEFDSNSVIDANFGEINQVFLNLMVNAAQADATKITLSSHRTGSSLEVRINDNGSGIPHHVLEKMYDPFFSTKGAGNSGLGLSICRRILEKHGADLIVETELSQGTTFIIRFKQ